MPAVFRRWLAEAGARGLVLTRLDQCLAAYPPAEWARLEGQLAALPAFSRPVKALTRILTSQATECDLDGQGRILLPASLRAAVGLQGEVIAVGVLNRVELWSPEAWEAFLRESERLLDDVTLDVQWPVPPAAPTAGALPESLTPPLRPQRKPSR